MPERDPRRERGQFTPREVRTLRIDGMPVIPDDRFPYCSHGETVVGVAYCGRFFCSPHLVALLCAGMSWQDACQTVEDMLH